LTNNPLFGQLESHKREPPSGVNSVCSTSEQN
jgi:hypothetical protein